MIIQLSLAEEPVCHCGLVLFTIMANLVTQKNQCDFTSSSHSEYIKGAMRRYCLLREAV